jgi:ribosomal protein L11 methyltransferase
MKSSLYYQVAINIVPAIREAVSSFLFDQNAQGLLDEENRIVAYFPETIDDEHLINEILTYLHDLRDMLELDFEIIVEIEELPQRDWNAEWKSRLKLLPVSDKILVKPTWVDMPENPPEIVIEMDPEMAFGSGEHATSRLTLQLIEKNIQPGISVLDIGVGTGILSIGALMLGAGSVVAFDVDPIATETSRRNAEKNNVDDRYFSYTGTLDALSESVFDMIAANVNRTQIAKLLPHAVTLLAPGGFCLISGILDIEEDIIIALCKKVGLNILSVSREKEWLAFEARKE